MSPENIFSLSYKNILCLCQLARNGSQILVAGADAAVDFFVVAVVDFALREVAEQRCRRRRRFRVARGKTSEQGMRATRQRAHLKSKWLFESLEFDIKSGYI